VRYPADPCQFSIVGPDIETRTDIITDPTTGLLIGGRVVMLTAGETFPAGTATAADAHAHIRRSAPPSPPRPSAPPDECHTETLEQILVREKAPTSQHHRRSERRPTAKLRPVGGVRRTHQKRAIEWYLYLHSEQPVPPAKLISPRHYRPATTKTTPAEHEPGPGLYTTGLSADEGLWHRKGWGGRS
jgi:hypothetical protein